MVMSNLCLLILDVPIKAVLSRWFLIEPEEMLDKSELPDYQVSRVIRYLVIVLTLKDLEPCSRGHPQWLV